MTAKPSTGGKGLHIWQVKQIAPTLEEIPSIALSLGLKWVSIKVCDGVGLYNLRWNGYKWVDDILPALVPMLKEAGLRVHGWGYVYGNNPTGEAEIALQRIEQLELDGFEIDAESQYRDRPNNKQAAVLYMAIMAEAGIPLGLCSYRFPSYHSGLPWAEFLNGCSYHAPQVYWNDKTGAASSELIRSHNELKALKNLPFLPLGRAYIGDGFTSPGPSPHEITQFLQTCVDLGLPGASFWSWDALKNQVGGLDRANAISSFDYPFEPILPPPIEPPDPPGLPPGDWEIFTDVDVAIRKGGDE